MKISILGYSGSGKSTLAKKLGEHYGAAVLHFDTIQFLPGWQVRSEEEKLELTRKFLDTHGSWVIDGTYSKLYLARRLEESDQIILMLFGRFSCLFRVIRRYCQYKNRTREDMGAGCNEKLDWEFVKWVLWKGRTKQKAEKFRRICEQHPQKVIVLKNQKQLDAYLQKTLAFSAGVQYNVGDN